VNAEIKTDFHLHTTFSDGTRTPEQTVSHALELGLSALAITDHDTIAGVSQALAAAKATSVRAIPGIEFSTDYEGQEVHILGFGMDIEAAALREALELMIRKRDERNVVILEKLGKLGLPLKLEQVLEIAQGRVIARPHIARAMLQAGYVRSMQEAFDRYLAKGAAAFIERFSLTPQQACQAITHSGGLSVFAHPGKVRYQGLINELIPAGLRGLEIFHPDHAPSQKRKLLAIAKELNLLVTGGSDSHGPASPRPAEMGSQRLPSEYVQALLEALEENQ